MAESSKHVGTKRVVLCGIMVAIAVVLDGFFKLPVTLFGGYALKLSFGMVPILFLSIRFGPVYGGMCGALMDFLQAVLFPMGGYNPLFTVSALVMGAVPGLFFLGKANTGRLRVFLAVVCGQAVGSVLLGSLFLVVSYGLPWAVLIPRGLTQAVLVPVYTLLLLTLFGVEQVSRKVSLPA